jgi:hypothetical protein
VGQLEELHEAWEALLGNVVDLVKHHNVWGLLEAAATAAFVVVCVGSVFGCWGAATWGGARCTVPLGAFAGLAAAVGECCVHVLLLQAVQQGLKAHGLLLLLPVWLVFIQWQLLLLLAVWVLLLLLLPVAVACA